MTDLRWTPDERPDTERPHSQWRCGNCGCFNLPDFNDCGYCGASYDQDTCIEKVIHRETEGLGG